LSQAYNFSKKCRSLEIERRYTSSRKSSIVLKRTESGSIGNMPKLKQHRSKLYSRISSALDTYLKFNMKQIRGTRFAQQLPAAVECTIISKAKKVPGTRKHQTICLVESSE